MNVNGTKSIAIHNFYKYSIKVITIHEINKSPEYRNVYEYNIVINIYSIPIHHGLGMFH